MNEHIASISDFDEGKLAAALVAVQSALRVTIEELAKLNEGKGQEWFDALEEVVIRDAKGTVTEGISIQTEAEALKFGVDVLQATLNASRNQLGLAAKE
ncbi:hypothetical protein CN157_16115 [Sinorhizobium meliloti]|uniref:hypothetical protein n=1 Tax=Rhizobium meliloti TaxID=382 RepID=UPI0004064844|nr:hypothetical protein [Sinorhizobium meliloti]MDX0955557.1 hypothetical protein [Sinorhizobium medicae]MDE3829334.1 hypothetical protein [Sinorhizobium meliloti]MDE4577419.1 hypothetical protein [Sinorhizobium meliloti]MDX0185092.1 hypothetical protein [Sinorhizobium meliloti]RVK76016.1 hypothetical protein CN157_16115 [Sinorhizobium meliloti]